VLTGGALSLAAVAGSTLGRAQPASAGTQAFGPWTEVTPSNDKSGNMDATAINGAFNALPMVTDTDTQISYRVGSVVLAPGDFYVNSQITKPPKADLIGSGPGTVIHVVGNITGISSHHVATSGPFQHATKSGTIANLVVDGTDGGASAIGIDVGDGWGHRIDHVWVNNFTGTSAIGLSVCNRQFWTEKFQARHVTLVNNTTAVQHWLSGVMAQSQEYQDVEYYIWVVSNQNGIIVQGVHWNGSMRVRGNVQKGAGGNAVLTLKADPSVPSAGNAAMRGFFDISTEVNAGTGTVNPASINFADGNQGPFFGTGFLRFTGGQTNAAAGQLQFRGMVIEGNNTIQAVTAPSPFPAPGATTTNMQNDANVYITGGTITQIQVNGITTGITATTGQVVSVFLPAGGTISVTYTGSPSWTWISAL